MAYVAVDNDERLEEGPEGLQFKCNSAFLGDANGNQGGARSPGLGNADREYYQSYFDVDTKTVLRRCYSTLLPSSSDYLSTHLNPADLYGPFWTLTTLIFTLFLSSSLAASITAYLSDPGTAYDYDFGLLSVAVPLVYSVGEWSVVEAIAIWGYGMFVWIPVSILAVIPFPTVRWSLVGIAFGLSGYFLVRNVYPILASAEAKATRLIIIVIAALHAGLAITFKLLFFSYDIIAPAAPAPPAPSDMPAGNDTTPAEVLRRMFFS
ncbi:hypothetical protein C8F04DRAFT_1097158 [Mycena alexandri]|uniref:Protein YIP n=1 Tax=Mycena alexandri TaxID=1745969 RepID=A0AAD6SXN0_9AGAR|nr:hypothetical protein C8F04DRAFT_1097158 [Mycena alexandri]